MRHSDPGLRKQLLKRRRALSKADQACHAREICARIKRRGWLRKGQRVGAYASMPGELDPTLIINFAHSVGCFCYLPVISHVQHRIAPDVHGGHLVFRHMKTKKLRLKGQLGIRQPPPSITADQLATKLDVIFVPLVGFDQTCQRVGMGKGYYDRTLRRKNRLPAACPPLLIGIAHQCQQTDQLSPDSWDVRLDYVVTERHIYSRRSMPEN